MKVKLDLVEGVEGQCIYLNDRRICGPKPWGGGRTIKTWDVEVQRIEDALTKGGPGIPPTKESA
jgi:hypothetical protein